MAKRSNPEEEYLEDYDADSDDEKPKKKSKKKKGVGKIIAWIVAFIVVLAILIFIRYKFGATDTADQTATDEQSPATEVDEQEVTTSEKDAAELDREYQEAGVYVPPKDVGDQVVPKEEMGHVEPVVDVTDVPQLFSNMACNYDYDAGIFYISLRIYNTLTEDIKISPRGVEKGYNTYFNIKGMVDRDPGCGTELLLPGEWTDCKKIGFEDPRYMNLPGINRISVQVPVDTQIGTEALLIECPAAPEGETLPVVENNW
jgi:hypothetical protein